MQRFMIAALALACSTSAFAGGNYARRLKTLRGL